MKTHSDLDDAGNIMGIILSNTFNTLETASHVNYQCSCTLRVEWEWIH